MKISIAICTNRQVKAKTVLSLLGVVAHTEHEIHPVVATEGFTTAENRNYCVYQALKNGSDFLLFVDDDMTFDADTIDRLLAHGKEIVGVASNSRVLPKSPTVGLMDENGEYMHPDRTSPHKMKIPESLFKAFFVGTGVMLIDMKVFEKLPKPWFKFTMDDNGQVTKGEDGYFCEQARAHGIDIWCDPTLSIGHIGDLIF